MIDYSSNVLLSDKKIDHFVLPKDGLEKSNGFISFWDELRDILVKIARI